jgi:Fic family protein
MAAYIHELDGWPTLTWDAKRLQEQLAAVRLRQGKLLGRMETLGLQRRAEAVLETLTEDVLKSSEIEGELLDKEQVRSSIARRLGLDIGGLAPADRNVEGVVEMMLDATQSYQMPLTQERLFAWHAALFPTGRSGMSRIIVGGWRDATSGPMQVVSGPIGRERVHYEAPAADRLPHDMQAFLDWFGGDAPIDPILKAAVAHLWFVTIHPFDDGNGRIARAIADLALARSENSPQRFYSMSGQIRIERSAYYDILEATQKGSLDITAWLQWFLACLDRAFDGAEAILANVLRKARFWETLGGQPLNARQTAVISRLLEGFEGKMTTSKWAKLTKTSTDTALRDIDDLVWRRILVKDGGGGRSTSYSLIVTPADALRAVAAFTRAYSTISAWDSAAMPSSDERAARQSAIETLANQISDLAQRSESAPVTYSDFRVVVDRLHELGFHPANHLVSAVTFALHRADGGLS